MNGMEWNCEMKADCPLSGMKVEVWNILRKPKSFNFSHYFYNGI